MLLSTLAIVLLQISFSFAMPTISSVGAKFFTSEGKQWYIKGVAYQLTPDDPLLDTNQCKKDVDLMKKLGVNAIRVYHVDGKKDHSGCMSILSDAGIYLFVDLDTFQTYITPLTPEWDKARFEAYQVVLDEFQKYDNTAGVLVGNEVLNQPLHIPASAFVLAAGRDIKLYRDQKGYRNIPVGYSAADIAELRPMLQNYMACRPDPSERLDFFALNSYEWCGSAATYTTSGYSNLQDMTADYNIPIFFSETGCNVPPPRTFGDQAAIFGPDMSNTWSGSIVYEWVQEKNMYGLVSYGDPMAPNFSSDPEPVQPDYNNLQSQWAHISPTGVSLSAYDTAAVKPVACPTKDASWSLDPSSPLPTLGAKGDFTPDPTSSGSSTASGTSSTTTTAAQGNHQSSSASSTGSAAKSSSQKSDGASNSMLNLIGRIRAPSGEGRALSAMGMALVAIGAAFFWL